MRCMHIRMALKGVQPGVYDWYRVVCVCSVREACVYICICSVYWCVYLASIYLYNILVCV